MAVKIEGTCEARFGRVREIFADSFVNGIEVGAAVAAVLDGKTVFDLWGGYADKAKTKSWTRDTLVNVWSTTKGITSICAHRLVDQGKLDLDAPVAKYWPAENKSTLFYVKPAVGFTLPSAGLSPAP